MNKNTKRFFLTMFLILSFVSCKETDTGNTGNTDDDSPLTDHDSPVTDDDTGDTGNTADDSPLTDHDSPVTDDDTGNTGDTGDTGDTGNTGNTGDSCNSDTEIDDMEGIYPECTPCEKRECYEGPSSTKGVGLCKAGVTTCTEDGTEWGECLGQVLPKAEICGDGIDQNCDGSDMTHENKYDIDGDGYTYCDGDCCETYFDCPFPESVNSGSKEIAGNGIDDNCNGKIDE
ncbi:MAG TPA: MopE-related protein [bacterium]|nr:MopE-related protein [bacterium]